MLSGAVFVCFRRTFPSPLVVDARRKWQKIVAATGTKELRLAIRTLMILGLLLTAEPACAGTSYWGTNDDPTVIRLVAAETMWAALQCGPKPEMAANVADDFQGTSSRGVRYGRAEAIRPGKDRDCKLGSVKVHFVTDNVAILYGAESRIVKRADRNEAPRCQVWTDTWIKRDDKWQVVAAQDNMVPCKGK